MNDIDRTESSMLRTRVDQRNNRALPSLQAALTARKSLPIAPVVSKEALPAGRCQQCQTFQSVESELTRKSGADRCCDVQ